MTRLAVIGLGYWGPNLVRNFRSLSNCAVTVLCDRDERALAAMRLLYPGIETTTDVAGVFADGRVDAVAIATPVSTHYPLAKRALESGKHVFVEKPLTADLAEARELAELAARARRILMVDHTFLYTPAVAFIKRMVETGEVGDVLYFDSVRINLGLFQHDANVVTDLAPHDLAIMTHVVPSRPITVQAVGIDHVGNGFEDMAYITVGFEEKVVAHFHVNWLSPVKVRRILVGGSKKMLIYDDLSDDEKIKVYDKGVDLAAGEDGSKVQPLYRLGDLHVPHLGKREALQTAASHFLECIATGREPLTGARNALTVVELLCAAQQSLARNGELVRLSGTV